jgi:hypothetical protein
MTTRYDLVLPHITTFFLKIVMGSFFRPILDLRAGKRSKMGSSAYLGLFKAHFLQLFVILDNFQKF